MSTAIKEMPKYECHKKVHALKIKDIQYRYSKDESVDAILTPCEPGYEPIRVSEAYWRKHQPEVNGYYVVYEDGYESFSPALVFERGYTRIP